MYAHMQCTIAAMQAAAMNGCSLYAHTRITATDRGLGHALCTVDTLLCTGTYIQSSRNNDIFGNHDIFGNRKINKCLDYEVTTKSDGIVLDFNRVKSGPHVLMPGS